MNTGTAVLLTGRTIAGENGISPLGRRIYYLSG